jgi:hypothetical protein
MMNKLENSMLRKDALETHMQTVYRLGQITYLPHYRNDSVFVGPGYPRHTQAQYSVADLLAAGAEKDTLALWHRGSGGTVNAQNL